METTLDYICNLKMYQPRAGYRFSVDAPLLYSFVNIGRVSRIADLGAGSGIIGLLLARKYPGSDVTLIELQDSYARLAEENIRLNALNGRVRAIKADIRGIRTDRDPRLQANSFDLVVSNPPFRKPLSGRISPEQEKAIARHEIMLDLASLLDAASLLLRHNGRFCVIYHPERLLELLDTLREKRLEPKRLRFIHSNASSEAKMVLIEAVKGGRAGLKIARPLFIYRGRGIYSDEIEAILSPLPAATPHT